MQIFKILHIPITVMKGKLYQNNMQQRDKSRALEMKEHLKNKLQEEYPEAKVFDMTGKELTD